jgi:HEAT repeat protein
MDLRAWRASREDGMTDDNRIAHLIAALDDPDKPAVRAAVDALIALAPGSDHLQKILHHRLIEAGCKNYWPVAYVLGHLENPSSPCIEILIDGLDHPEPDIRWAIGLLLVRIAKLDGALIRRLIETSARGTPNQKRMALYCLRDLALSDSASRAALFSALRDGDPTVRVAAAIALKTRPDLDEVEKKTLLQVFLTDADGRVRNAIVITLASLGIPSQEFLDALSAARESEDAQIRKAANAATEILKKRRSASTGGLRGR